MALSYEEKKIAHLRRQGLVGRDSTGYGRWGGVAPDWLNADRKERDDREKRRQERAFYYHTDDGL